MKRILALLLALITIITSLTSLTACEKKDVSVYTKGEWIKKLSETYGMTTPYSTEPYFEDVSSEDDCFNAVQACAEWEIIEKGGKFNPDDRADVNFAIETAIKSIGLDRIENSKDGEKLSKDKEFVEYFNKKSDVKYISGSSLYSDTADDILNDLTTMYTGLEYKTKENVELTDTTLLLDESNIKFSMDGETAILTDKNAKVGDIIVIEPSSYYPNGIYAKVTEVNGNTIKYTQPKMEEVIERVEVSGSYTPEILGVIPLIDGVTVSQINGSEAVPQSYYNGDSTDNLIYVRNPDLMEIKSVNLGDIEFFFQPKVNGFDLEGKLKLKDMKVNADVDMWGIVVKKADLSVDTKLDASIEFSTKEKEIKKSIPVAKIPCKLFGVLGIDFVLSLEFGIEGSVSFSFNFDTTAGVTYKPLRSPKFNVKASNPNLDMELKAKAFVKPQVKAEFVIGVWALVNVGVYSGFEASAAWNVNLAGASDKNCVDINAFIPLVIFIGAENKETLLGKLGVKKSFDIWDENNSPIHKNWHIEDFKIVPECTKDKQEENEEENGTDNDENITEDVFEDIPTAEEAANFVDSLGSYLSISSYYAVLEEKSSDILKVDNIPQGYSMSDIRFESTDPSVATVTGDGRVNAVNNGSCIIKVSTADGLYAQYCAVNVLASYYVDFTPLVEFYNQENYNGISV